MLTLDLTRFTVCAPATCCQAQMLTRCPFQIYCNAQSPVRCVLKWPYLTGLLLALFCSSPDIVITRIGHHYVRGVYKTVMLPVHGVFPTADVSGLHLSGYLYYVFHFCFCTLSCVDGFLPLFSCLSQCPAP